MHLRLFKFFCAVLIAAFIGLSTSSAQVGFSTSSFPYGVEFNPVPPHSGMEFANPDRAEVRELVAKTKKLGCNWVRLSIHWQHWLSLQGDTNWVYYDMVFEDLHKAGLNILACPNGKHKWLSNDKPPIAGKELKHWLSFISLLTKRYGQYTTNWEIWNEPNFDAFWALNPLSEDYHTLAKASIEVIRKEIPQAKIALGSLARADVPYAKKLLALPKLDAQIFTIHPYSEWPEANVHKVKVAVATPQLYQKLDHSIAELKQVTDSLGLQLWQGECGYPSRANSHGWQGLGPWSEQVQTKWLLRRYVTDMEWGAQGFFYFALKDFNLAQKQNAKGLLRNDGVEKQVFTVYKNIIQRFPKGVVLCSKAKSTQIEIAREGDFPGFTSHDVRSICFKDANNEYVTAIYFNARIQHQVNPATIKMHFSAADEAPIAFSDFASGKEQKLSAVKTKDGVYVELPCTDYPVFLFSKNPL